jgi:hypothetical protein
MKEARNDGGIKGRPPYAARTNASADTNISSTKSGEAASA